MASGGSRWVILIIFFVLLLLGAGAIYLYVRSRGGFAAVCAGGKTQVQYVRQHDNGPEYAVQNSLSLLSVFSYSCLPQRE